MNVEKARIDSFTTLAVGSTTGELERTVSLTLILAGRLEDRLVG
nr:MAG TPA: hypothetical protein [Caudoviricetes sp.]